MERFGETVRKARVAKRITLAELSQYLGYTAMHLSDVERGNRNPPSEDKIIQWAQFLDLDADQLLDQARVAIDTVKLRVHHDPRKAEVALAFARRIDNLSDRDRDEILRVLLEGDAQNE